MSQHPLPTDLHLETLAVRLAADRSQYGENSEALYLTSGYVQPSAEASARRFAGEGDGHDLLRLGAVEHLGVLQHPRRQPPASPPRWWLLPVVQCLALWPATTVGLKSVTVRTRCCGRVWFVRVKVFRCSTPCP